MVEERATGRQREVSRGPATPGFEGDDKEFGFYSKSNGEPWKVSEEENKIICFFKASFSLLEGECGGREETREEFTKVLPSETRTQVGSVPHRGDSKLQPGHGVVCGVRTGVGVEVGYTLRTRFWPAVKYGCT